MLWIEPGIVVSYAALGGMIGGLFVSFAWVRGNKHIDRENSQISDDLWRIKSSICSAHDKINEINNKISTILVNKPVSNDQNYNNYGGID